MANTLTLPNEELLGEVEELLNMGLAVRIKPKGRSMEPFIHEATDEVVLKKMDFPKVGQIALAKLADGKFVIHRIIKIHDQQVVLMGDGNIRETEQCASSQILGVVSQIVRKDKTIDCQSFKMLTEYWIWRHTRPFRNILLRILQVFSSI